VKTTVQVSFQTWKSQQQQRTGTNDSNNDATTTATTTAATTTTTRHSNAKSFFQSENCMSTTVRIYFHLERRGCVTPDKAS